MSTDLFAIDESQMELLQRVMNNPPLLDRPVLDVLGVEKIGVMIGSESKALLLQRLGIKYTLIQKPVEELVEGFEELTPQLPPDCSQIFYFGIKSKDVVAKAVAIPNGKLVVLAGSQCVSQVTPKAKPEVVKWRERLRKRGVINDTWTFVSNYTFHSPSQAASVVAGRNTNGRTAWVDARGMQYAELK